MKSHQIHRFLAGSFGVLLCLLSLLTATAPCDEACSADAPECACPCVCYGIVLEAPTNGPTPDRAPAQYALQGGSAQHSLLLVNDIFRPPIA